MRMYLNRFLVLFLITSFILSIAIGCGGRQRKQIKSLKNRIDSLEKNMETMNKNMSTIQKTIDRVDSLDKRVTTWEQRAYDMEKSKTGVITTVPVETEVENPETEQ
jgi:hypothetical protein